jgi:hypothetical protein
MPATKFAINGWCDQSLDWGFHHIGFQGGGVADAHYAGLFTTPGVLHNFKMKWTAAAVAITTVTLKLMRYDGHGQANSVDTAIVLTFAIGDTYQEDLLNDIVVAKGDSYEWDFGGAAKPIGRASWTADFEPTAAGELPMSQATYDDSQTSVFGCAGLFGGFLATWGGVTPDVNAVKTIMAHPGQMQHFAARYHRYSSLWPDINDLTLMKNGIATAVVFHAVAGANAWHGDEDFYLYDDATVIDFIPGDEFWWEAAGTGPHLSFTPYWLATGFTFIGMDYEVYCLTSGVPNRNNGANLSMLEYNNTGFWVAFDPGAPTFFTSMRTSKDICTAQATLRCKTAPGVGKYWEVELWANGVATGLKSRVSDLETVKTVTGTFTLPIDSYQIDWVLTPSGAPALDYVSVGLLLGPSFAPLPLTVRKAYAYGRAEL